MNQPIRDTETEMARIQDFLDQHFSLDNMISIFDFMFSRGFIDVKNSAPTTS